LFHRSENVGKSPKRRQNYFHQKMSINSSGPFFHSKYIGGFFTRESEFFSCTFASFPISLVQRDLMNGPYFSSTTTFTISIF
jgi:hypothetical protein